MPYFSFWTRTLLEILFMSHHNWIKQSEQNSCPEISIYYVLKTTWWLEVIYCLCFQIQIKLENSKIVQTQNKNIFPFLKTCCFFYDPYIPSVQYLLYRCRHCRKRKQNFVFHCSTRIPPQSCKFPHWDRFSYLLTWQGNTLRNSVLW